MPARTASRSRAAPRSRRTRSTTTSGAAPRRDGRSRTSTQAAPDDVFQLVTRPEEAPDEPQVVTVGFERGRPVSLDGEQLGLVELLERAAEIGERHGVGIVDHIEDRVVGLKVRDLYEVPAAAIVLAAHRELEKLVCTIHQNNFKGALESQWAYLCYAGLWLEPLRRGSRRLHGLGQRVRHRRGGAEALPRLVTPVESQLAVRPLRPLACIIRRIRGRVLTAREPRVHRALHACRAGWPTEFERRARSDLRADRPAGGPGVRQLRYGREIRIAAGAGLGAGRARRRRLPGHARGRRGSA